MKRTLPLLLLAALAPGCTTSPPAQWWSSEALSQPREKILQAMADVLRAQGFDTETRDDAQGVIVSKWRVMLRPQWREGRRERVEMRLERAPVAGRHILRVITYREANDNAKTPLSLADASWIGDGGNDEISRAIVYLVRTKVTGLGLND